MVRWAPNRGAATPHIYRREITMARRNLTGIWPAPVYVGTFADGEVVRMSFWSQQGKPIDFDRGRRGVMLALGNERTRAKAHPVTREVFRFIPPEFRRPSYRQGLAETAGRHARLAVATWHRMVGRAAAGRPDARAMPAGA
jgi:hypothetical protein